MRRVRSSWSQVTLQVSFSSFLSSWISYSYLTNWNIYIFFVNLINRRREYNCHQCFYNTSCSNSFEFHLHGHLNKKRAALWTKPLTSKFEGYKCPCGYSVKSSTSSGGSSLGNKVAEHLNHCEYKYCYLRSKEDSGSYYYFLNTIRRMIKKRKRFDLDIYLVVFILRFSCDENHEWC